MDLKRAKEIESGLVEARAYFLTNFTRGVMDGVWVVTGSKGERYVLSQFPDQTYQCTCPAYVHRGECKHGQIINILGRVKEVQEEVNDRPLQLTGGHYEVLEWFTEHHIMDKETGITSRELVRRMGPDTDRHADQWFMSRVCELHLNGYLAADTDGLDLGYRDRTPPDSKYYLTMKGRRTVTTRVQEAMA